MGLISKILKFKTIQKFVHRQNAKTTKMMLCYCYAILYNVGFLTVNR